MVIPDLEALFCKWPQGTNPELELLSQDMEKKLESYVIFEYCRFLRLLIDAMQVIFEGR